MRSETNAIVDIEGDDITGNKESGIMWSLAMGLGLSLSEK